MYACMYVCMYVSIYVCMSVCMYICMYVYMYICLCVCVCLFVRVCVCVCYRIHCQCMRGARCEKNLEERPAVCRRLLVPAVVCRLLAHSAVVGVPRPRCERTIQSRAGPSAYSLGMRASIVIYIYLHNVQYCHYLASTRQGMSFCVLVGK